jgi:CPA2 family monovalent cation:H+ antiporter-2
MIFTPFMVQAGPTVGKLLLETPLRHFARVDKTNKSKSFENAALEDHVIIIGYGPAGRHLVQVLRDTGIPFIVIEMNPESVKEMQKNDVPAIFGDASRPYILNLADIRKAKLCVIATNDPASSPRIIQRARHLNPTIQIIVRSRYLSEFEYFEEMGADIVVPEEMETTVRLFFHVLGAYMVPQEEINSHIQTMRAEDYGIIRGSIQEAHLMVLQGLDEEGLHTRAVAVREGSPAAGKTLKDLQLRNVHQLTVLAVKRGDHTIGNPDGNFELHSSDRLIMVGDAEQFVKCADIFRS